MKLASEIRYYTQLWQFAVGLRSKLFYRELQGGTRGWLGDTPL